MIVLNQKNRILFTGDSVTDCGRDRSDPHFLSTGYPFMIASRLGADLPEMELEFLNTGISGNRVGDLNKRWIEDCIALKPDVLSILIGINDTWRRYDSNLIESADEFKHIYCEILEKVKDALPKTQIVIMEPFLLNSLPDRAKWREDLNPKIDAVREVAVKYADTFLPLDGMFAEAACRGEMAHWLPDGVHPSCYGHSLIADAWIENVCF